MRVAAIYDIHANLPALDAALAAVAASDADLTIVGGDIAWGPMPRETMERLLGLGEHVTFIRGDADRDVAEADDEVSSWCRAQLTEEQRAFLAAQQERLVLDLDGLGPTLFCHGSPRSDRDRITVGTAEEKVLPWLAGVGEQVVVCGHTHAQFQRRFGRHRVVNPGSVGLQFGERGAHWAILGHGVDFRRSDYDYEDAAARILATQCSVKGTFAERVLDPPPAVTAVERWG